MTRQGRLGSTICSTGLEALETLEALAALVPEDFRPERVEDVEEEGEVTDKNTHQRGAKHSAIEGQSRRGRC